ncbi:hypothetical protein, partial [Legionella pneumophila]|uniref:hypothetical protein n=9 Tax=Legionella pneumophila TaxID=446 RepID=UPI000AD9A0A4
TMSPRLPKVIYQIFNLQLLRRYAPRNDGPKNRTVQRKMRDKIVKNIVNRYFGCSWDIICPYSIMYDF